MESDNLILKIKEVLDCGMSPYMIAKKVGYSSANPVHKLINGKSKIEDMSLRKAMDFERIYESEIKATRRSTNGRTR